MATIFPFGLTQASGVAFSASVRTSLSVLSSLQQSMRGPGRSDRMAGQALESLAHAIEYLEDTMPLSYEESPRTIAIAEAIDLLKVRNRAVFAESTLLNRTQEPRVTAQTGTPMRI